MSKGKRYSLTIDFYIYARNDREAMVKAAYLTGQMRKEKDNEAQVMTLDEVPYGDLIMRRVHTGTLTLFENKLIELPIVNLSDCCGAEIIHSDLCSNCKEHI